ncbi:MAG: hypothetical protein ACTHJN_02725 [Ginsengibacter sp.]
MFIQTFSSLFIEADFYANQSYIAKNLCVNRNKPMMHCNGKCYLAKKLNDQDKNQTPTGKNERIDVLPFFVPDSFSFVNTITLIKQEYFIQDETTLSSYYSSVFHPPTV